MKKYFVIKSMCDETFHIDKVFTDKQNAMLFCKTMNDENECPYLEYYVTEVINC